ncbi:MAG: restriction endonuclease [Firmicutes bacterium]|nr:restriction endonuclease [Bacillota bacterium]
MEAAIFLALLAVLGFGIYWAKEYRQKTTLLNSTITQLTRCNKDMKITLLKGLIRRFGNGDDDEETPWDFERFVGRVLEQYYNCSVEVTMASNDYGVDLRLHQSDGLYLGQVKCYQEDNKVGFEPIAIIHSQMLKQKARGGYVVTTSDYTANARQYAADLNIRLINGCELVEMWTETVEAAETKNKAAAKPQQA